MKKPRLFQDENDLSAMLEILERGRMAENGTYYVHTGDLKWWLYYPPLERDLWDHIYLWYDDAHPERLLGWALISRESVSIDVYTQPELRESQLAKNMYLWAEEKATQLAHQNGKRKIHSLWVSHDDAVLLEHYHDQDFCLGRGLAHMVRDLDEELPIVRTIDGFVLRNCNGLVEVTQRATAQYEAFESKAPFELYQRRFENFMHSPVYQSELDIVAVSPAGHIASFCIIWIDPVNQVGLFEPVGTHPDFQRKGLGRAVMQKGLHHLQECGMRKAVVSANEDNLPAIDFYKSVGFQVTKYLGTFEKDVLNGECKI